MPNKKEIAKEKLDIYAGILFNNQQFDEGNNEEITYHFDCKEYQLLKEKYNLEEIAKKGSDFNKAKRLLSYLAPRLTHSSWYDNHVPCNALDLLEYSLNNPNQGINCLNKSKILEECCLALGIYARRVSIMPYSPYDFDSHVVVEIYDRKLKKWIMLDPTTNGYFVDENKTPLSLLEMRDKFANAKFITYVSSTSRLNNLKQLKEKYVGDTAYICKNLFYFYIDKDSTFGDTKTKLVFVPKNYSIKNKSIANLTYRINNLEEDQQEWKEYFKKQLEGLSSYQEDERTNISSALKSPLK